MKTTKKYSVWVFSIALVAAIAFGNIGLASAHAPNYVDIKYYDLDFTNDDNAFINDNLATLDNNLSIYVTHGVSNSSYHYVGMIIVEFFDLPQSFLEEYNGTEFIDHEDQEFYPDGTLKSDRIQEADVSAVHDELVPSPLPNLQPIYVNYTSQETHQVFHLTIIIEIPEWILIRATAVCVLGGNRSQEIISGHPYYDIEHSMIEAAVPAIICAVIVLTPLTIWRVFGKKPEEVKH